MKISESQLIKIVKEELSKTDEGTYYPGRAVGEFSDRDADNAVAAAISQIQDLLEDAYKAAERDPSHQDRGEGQAMANLVRFVDEIYGMYGSGDTGGEF